MLRSGEADTPSGSGNEVSHLSAGFLRCQGEDPEDDCHNVCVSSPVVSSGESLTAALPASFRPVQWLKSSSVKIRRQVKHTTISRYFGLITFREQTCLFLQN